MGQKKKKVVRVVLDTNILIFALLFHGEMAQVVQWWESGNIIPLISRETFEELREVLSYSKFSLSENQINAILQDWILPYFEVVSVRHPLRTGCRDPNDEKFIECAFFGHANHVVTGDKDLLILGRWRSIEILSWSRFAEMVKKLPSITGCRTILR